MFCAVRGNILGAWMGAEAAEDAFDPEKLELRDVIGKIWSGSGGDAAAHGKPTG